MSRTLNYIKFVKQTKLENIFFPKQNRRLEYCKLKRSRTCTRRFAGVIKFRRIQKFKRRIYIWRTAPAGIR